MEEILVEYDSTADVLDIWYRDPSTVDTSRGELRGNVITRTDDDTGKVIGVTVLNLSKQDTVEGLPVPALSP